MFLAVMIILSMLNKSKEHMNIVLQAGRILSLTPGWMCKV